MTTLATLQSRLADIEKAYASGTLTIRHGELSQTFRSLAEMERIMASLRAQIDAMSGTTKRRVRYAYQSGKGL